MRLTRLVFLIGFLLSTHAFAQSALEWSGDWDTFWRDGEARMTLRQAGDRVDGRYAPGDGTIEGRIDGRLLRGVWRQDGAEGEIVFALSEDGQIFTGRFAGGEYWNGSRVAAATQPEQVAAPDTPREALRRLVNLGNALVYGGEVAASGALGRLLVYAGEPADEREQRRRRQMLWTLIDLSTFRIYDAPRRVIGDLAEFSIVQRRLISILYWSFSGSTGPGMS